MTSDQTVVFDSGWVEDGHFFHWDLGGTFIEHPDKCPYEVRGGIRYYFCPVGIEEDRFGLFIDDLPPQQANLCYNEGKGGEPIEWRSRESIHPDMDDAVVEAVRKVDIRLA